MRGDILHRDLLQLRLSITLLYSPRRQEEHEE
jgi:hypothetical protein